MHQPARRSKKRQQSVLRLMAVSSVAFDSFLDNGFAFVALCRYERKSQTFWHAFHVCQEAKMQPKDSIAEHWGKGDVYGPILAALKKAGKSLDALTVEDLAPVDHFHARGLPATVELGERLPVKPGQHILDI